MKLKSIHIIPTLSASLLFLLPNAIQAQPTAHYSPGSEGILCASVPPPGVYLRDYNIFYTSDRVNDGSGHSVGPANFSTFTYAQVPRIIWVTDWKVLGADYLLNVIPPITYQKTTAGPFKSSTLGVGDVYVDNGLAWHVKQFDFVLVPPPAVRVRGSNGKEQVIDPPRQMNEQDLQKRARLRSEIIRRNGFLVRRPMDPLLAWPEWLGRERGCRMKRDLEEIWTKQGFDVGFGDHLAWSESSAVSYANSVIGARTNREGGPSALSAALVGKTANYGLHLDENRIPEISIDVEFSLKESDYGALGYVAGKLLGSKVPVFYLKDIPKTDELKALGAAMAASGAVALYHVNGVTPEIRKLDFEEPAEKIIIERDQLDDIYESRKKACC